MNTQPKHALGKLMMTRVQKCEDIEVSSLF